MNRNLCVLIHNLKYCTMKIEKINLKKATVAIAMAISLAQLVPHKAIAGDYVCKQYTNGNCYQNVSGILCITGSGTCARCGNC